MSGCAAGSAEDGAGGGAFAGGGEEAADGAAGDACSADAAEGAGDGDFAPVDASGGGFLDDGVGAGGEEHHADGAADAGSLWGNVAPKPSVVGRLPTSITVAELAEPARLDTEPWHLSVGIRESDLGLAEIDVYEGEHVLVAGPARSGKSTLLLALAESLQKSDVTIWGVCGRRSPLPQAELDRCAVGPDEATALLASARVHNGPLVLLVDDAKQFADDDQAFAGLISARTSDLLIVAAGRSDDLRSLYSHWTKTIRKARCGVLFQPNVDYDGELLGVTLPRRAPVAITPGRGYIVSGGTVDFRQAMRPTKDLDLHRPGLTSADLTARCGRIRRHHRPARRSADGSASSNPGRLTEQPRRAIGCPLRQLPEVVASPPAVTRSRPGSGRGRRAPAERGRTP